MRPKTSRLLLPALLLPLTALSPEPGGWAVLTVEDLPDHLVAGEPVELVYTMRQHGQTLTNGLHGELIATQGDEAVRVTSRPGESRGEYRAAFTVPQPGLWTITVRSQFIPSMANTMDAKLLPIEAVQDGDTPEDVSDAERGRRLFIAKGCVTCHTHRRASSASSRLGPDLTEKHYGTDYLAMYLADPSIRPAARVNFPMPNLALGPEEIAGLTAFINAEADAGVESRGPASRQ